MLRAIGDAAVGPAAGQARHRRGHRRRRRHPDGQPCRAGACRVAPGPAAAGARSPDATTCPAVTGRALRACEPAPGPARRGGRRLGWWVFARLASRTPWLAGLAFSASALAVSALVMLLAPWLILLSPRVRPLRDEAVTGRLHALASRANLRLAGLHEWVFGPHGDHANAALVGRDRPAPPADLRHVDRPDVRPRRWMRWWRTNSGITRTGTPGSGCAARRRAW